MIKTISLDLETYSSVDIAKSGVYRYAESDDFEILLLSFSIDGGEVQTIDLAKGEKIPEEILEALVSDDVQHWAFVFLAVASEEIRPVSSEPCGETYTLEGSVEGPVLHII